MGIAFVVRGKGSLPSSVSHHVDGNCNRQDYKIILPGLDFHAVGVASPESRLGDLCDYTAPFLDTIFVVEEIPLDVKVGAAADLGDEALA